MTETKTGLELLDSVEIGGREIHFEHGMLLLHRHANRGALDWYVVLLRVSLSDVTELTNDVPLDSPVLITTKAGRRFAGRAGATRFRTNLDGLRLIGTTQLERVDN